MQVGKRKKGYDSVHFLINWEQQTVTCPQGQIARQWSPALDQWGNAVIHAKFPHKALDAALAALPAEQAAEIMRVLEMLSGDADAA